MKRIALVFVLAVIGPSLALAWLATRSLRDQQLAIERQESIVAEEIAEKLTVEVSVEIRKHQRAMGRIIEELLATHDPAQLGWTFDTELRERWSLAEVGFAASLQGDVICPSPAAGRAQLKFRMENDPFLSSSESMEVIWNGPKGKINLTELDSTKSATKVRPPFSCVFVTKSMTNSMAPAVQSGGPFCEIVADSREGTLGRFVHDELNLLFWNRPARAPQYVYGAKINLPELTRTLTPLLQVPTSWHRQFVAALRDDLGRSAVISHAGFSGDWKRPLIAVEIGEVLPHWEIALYPLDPGQSLRAASTLRWSIGLLIGLLLVAISVGGWLIGTDVRRQLILVRQRTDFVSNVSHELKTPLTSIRLFAEMLSEQPVADPIKQKRFLAVIRTESNRLTRLINNVLDFSRLERGEKKFSRQRLDLREVVTKTVESCRPALENAGMKVVLEMPSQAVTVEADGDALSQVILNLVSNAEKYAASGREVTFRVRSDTAAGLGLVDCLDRGVGVPRGTEERIFEQFFRGHDSLASGIDGCGLGLTLARQIVEGHGGGLSYRHREGGGAQFTVRLPTID